MSKDEAVLAACPFCGGELVRRTAFAWSHEAKGCILTGYGVTRGEIERWNLRPATPPEPTGAMVEAHYISPEGGIKC